MLTQTQPRTRRVWEWLSIAIQVGDVLRLDCQPIVKVVGREQISPTQILIKVVPTNADADYRPTVWEIQAPQSEPQSAPAQPTAPAKTDRPLTKHDRKQPVALNKRLEPLTKSDRPTTEPTDEPNYLYKLKVGQLKELCKKRGLHGYSKLRQHQLILKLQKQEQELGNARSEAATNSEPVTASEPSLQISAIWNERLTGGTTHDPISNKSYRFLVVDEAELWQKSDLNKAKQPAIISCAPEERHQAILVGSETDLPHAKAALAAAPTQINAQKNAQNTDRVKANHAVRVSIKAVSPKPAAKKPAAQTGGEQRMPIAAMSAPTVAKQSAVSPKQSAKSP
ncbi:MAG: hypothetical protein F6J93_39980, partial [Oscillatoria sp. SIO1A7]|nr:hypothetical protein [Oscillatoria sp. SIO1A7]